MIEMQDVWKTYPNGTHALKGVSVKIDRNEFVYLVGPSGAGKSTFMKLIYREEVPTKGQISVNGFNIGKLKPRKIPYVRRNIGVIFQDFRLLPKLTAYENVAFALEVIEAPKKVIKKRVMEVLELVGLKNKANRDPSQPPAVNNSASPSRERSSTVRPSSLRTSLPATWIPRRHGGSYGCSMRSISAARRSSWPPITKKSLTPCASA